jgi:hypothetical protein
MRRTTMTILAVLAVLAVGTGFAAGTILRCPPPHSDQLVGLWESENKSKGGIGHTLEFRADGAFVEATTVLVDTYYRVSGDRLIISEKPIADTGDAGSSIPFKIEGNTLIQKERSGPSVRKERVGLSESGQAPIVGVWRYRHYTGAIAFERYTPEGRMYFRLPMTSSAGCYVSGGAKLTLARPNEKETQASFELGIDDLALRFPGREPARYHRAPAGPWYERERIDFQSPE